MGNKWVKILALIFANGINYLIGFLTAPYLSRALSYEDNGTYNQLLLLVNLFVLLGQFGIVNIITVFFADKRHEHSVTFISSVRVLLGSCLGATLLFLSGMFYLPGLLNNPELSKYIPMAAPALFLQALGSGITVILIYFDQVKTVSVFTVIANIVRVIGLFYCIQVLHSIDALVIWYVASTVIQNGVLFCFIPKTLLQRPFRYHKKLQHEMISKAWPLLLTSLLGMGVVYIDGFMVSGMLSVKDYALYRNGAIEIPFIATIYNSIASIMMPNFAKLYNEQKNNEMLTEKRNMSRLVGAIIFPVVVVLIVFSDKLIPLYLSDKYYDSFMVFAIYNLTTLIRVNDYQDLLTIAGKSKLILNINIGIFIYNIVANVVLLKLFGIIGCAVAFASSVYLLAFILARSNASVLNVSVKEYIDYTALFLMLFISVSVSLVMRYLFLVDSVQILFLSMVISCIVSYLLLYVFKFLPLSKIILIVKRKEL